MGAEGVKIFGIPDFLKTQDICLKIVFDLNNFVCWVLISQKNYMISQVVFSLEPQKQNVLKKSFLYFFN